MSGAPMVTLRGIGAAPGYAVGYAHVIDRDTRSVPVRHLTSHQVDQELARFDEAVEAAIAQLDAFLERLRTSPNEGTLILEAHRLILQDEMLLERTRDVIRDELLNAEAALERTLSTLEAAFENLDERYFRERGTDLRFAGSRVLAHLMGGHEMAPAAIESGAIIVAHELSPAQTLELSGLRISGFVTQVGGNASHTVIMARAMETPAVVGVAGVLDSVHHGQLLVVDGPGGVVIVDPDSETVAHYRELRESHLARQAALLEDRGVPADTLDGVRVTLEGNIEYVAEIESLLSHGGEGIGLFRTEYLFLRGGRAPDEETQVDEYRRILSEVAPRAATLRTVDLGADKLDETLGLDIDCDNPALGLRGVRLTLRQRGLLKTQLRALLRASVFGSLRLLVPFVSGVGEMRQVKEVLEEARAELAREGHASCGGRWRPPRQPASTSPSAARWPASRFTRPCSSAAACAC
jgi:phosphotransferase system enzyme I (PtsI)